MNKGLLGAMLLSALSLPTTYAQPDPGFSMGESTNKNKRVSPNGRYLVGETIEKQPWGLDAFSGYISFREDLHTGELTWVTSYDGEDWSTLGSFTDINDEGIASGVAKDGDYMLTVQEWGETFTLPLNVASIWDLDGKRTSLGIGTFSLKDFNNFADGSYAMAISNDSKVVGGYVAVGNFAFQYPCIWTLDEKTGKYEFKQLSLPEEGKSAVVTDVSGDGSIITGYIDYKMGRGSHACYWKSSGECVVIGDEPFGTLGQAFAVSNNGNYIGLTLNGRDIAIYMVGDNFCRKISEAPSPGATVEIGGITDLGDMVGTFNYREYSRPFWYYNGQYVATDFDYFLYLFASDFSIPVSFSPYTNGNIRFSGISADGNVIAGNADNFWNPWTLRTKQKYVSIPLSVDKVSAFMTAPSEITLSFTPGYKNFGNMQGKEYVIFRNGEKIGVVDFDTEADKDGYITYVDKNIPDGNQTYCVVIKYVEGNTELLSVRSMEKSIRVSNDFSFPLFDNFNSGTIATNGWDVVRDYGELDYQNWGTPDKFGLGGGHLSASCDQRIPYSFSIVSKMLDARDRESVYVSFARKWQYVNTDQWDMTKDSLSIEVTTNGREWLEAKHIPFNDIEAGRWRFEYIDLSDLAAGKTFQMRLRLHGQAKAMYSWSFDNLRIDEKPDQPVAADVLGLSRNDGSFHLTWKNSIDAYQLNYLGNPFDNAFDFAVGNEGRPLICVNKFDRESLGIYRGKYLTSVTTAINHDYELDGDPATASIVVYEDGKLIREQEITETDANTNFTVILDEPVLIDGNKDICVGLKLIKHAPNQLPILYHNTTTHIAGMSDLYSEDDGKTWLRYSDIAGKEQPEDGWASWKITANITDTENATLSEIDENRYAFEILKNGMPCNPAFIHWLQGCYDDPDSKVGDSYQIRVFTFDGKVSELSTPVVNTGFNSVTDPLEDACAVIKNGTLYINGDAVNVEIFDTAGLRLYSGNDDSISLDRFGKGLHIIVVHTNNNTFTRKMIF